MSRRRFTDSRGNSWEVYAIVVAPTPGVMQPAFSHQFHRPKAYLAFDSQTERRRLSPFPMGWDEMSDAELEELLRVATQISITMKRIEG